MTDLLYAFICGLKRRSIPALFHKEKEDILGHCFFPEIPWNRKNFFGNGRWNSGVIAGKDGHKEFRCNPIS